MLSLFLPVYTRGSVTISNQDQDQDDQLRVISLAKVEEKCVLVNLCKIILNA